MLLLAGVAVYLTSGSKIILHISVLFLLHVPFIYWHYNVINPTDWNWLFAASYVVCPGGSKVLTVQVVPVNLLQCLHLKYCRSPSFRNLEPQLKERPCFVGLQQVLQDCIQLYFYTLCKSMQNSLHQGKTACSTIKIMFSTIHRRNCIFFNDRFSKFQILVY